MIKKPVKADPITDVLPKLDAEAFQSKLKGSYAELARLIKSDLALLQQKKSLFSGFKKEDVIKWMRNPPQYQAKLNNLSRFLYGVSTHYQRLIGYFADMGVDSAWGVSFYGTDYLTKSQSAMMKYYNDTLEMIDVMNIPHEYNKIKTSMWTEGVYYGYEYSGDDSYFIQKLHADFCRINGIVDGAYVFEFNFNYFDTHPAELKTAAPEFRIKYNNYKRDKGKSTTDIFDPTPQWQPISAENSICLKIHENIDYIFPPFMGLFLDIYDIQDYKELKKVKEELENYMLLVAKIPLYTGDKEPEQYLLDMDNAIKYGQQIVGAIPDEVGFVISPFEKIEAIPVSETSQREQNAVSDAEAAMWTAAGVNQNIFSGEATTEGVMSFSVTADESTVFSVNRQFERWINRKIKFQELIKEKLTFYFLDVTVHNQKRKVQEYTNQVKNGQPFKIEMAAAQGLPPSRYMAKMWLENTALEIRDLMQPPLNSNVLSGKDGSDTDGRPTNDKVVENE